MDYDLGHLENEPIIDDEAGRVSWGNVFPAGTTLRKDDTVTWTTTVTYDTTTGCMVPSDQGVSG